MPDYSNLTNVTDLFELFGFVNNDASGFLGIAFLILFFFVSFIALSSFSNVEAIGTSAAMTGLLGIIMLGICMIKPSDFMITIVVVLVGFGIIYFAK